MVATVEIRLVTRNLPDTMGDMRVWLDHRRVALHAFRQSAWTGGMALHIEFNAQSDAVEFAGHFGGRVLGTARSADPAEAAL